MPVESASGNDQNVALMEELHCEILRILKAEHVVFQFREKIESRFVFNIAGWQRIHKKIHHQHDEEKNYYAVK